jgi:protocatechuate 4,5-dioxygenase beta chain
LIQINVAAGPEPSFAPTTIGSETRRGNASPRHPYWPDVKTWPVKIIPVSINTVQHPLPSAARCFKLGRAVGRAIESYDKNLKVVVSGTGGLSHQLDGQRAGFINKEFDLLCLEKIVNEPEALLRYSNEQIVELAGTQGVEFLNWLAMRGAMTGQVTQLHRNYHIPISNTAAATLVLGHQKIAQRRAA